MVKNYKATLPSEMIRRLFLQLFSKSARHDHDEVKPRKRKDFYLAIGRETESEFAAKKNDFQEEEEFLRL